MPLDDAETYFGKAGEVIVVGFSGARTYPRIGNPNQETREAPRSIEMKNPSSSYQQQNSGQYSRAGSQYQVQPAAQRSFDMGTPPSRATQQYANYSNQGGNRQSASSYSLPRQYSANSRDSYQSSASQRYY